MSKQHSRVEEVAKHQEKLSMQSDARSSEAVLSKYRLAFRQRRAPLEQAMGVVEDKLKYLRWERQVRLMEQANKFVAERGLSLPSRKVSLQIAIPLIQGGSLEENDFLQDRWAALLVNAADASSDTEVRRAFISILEDLTPLDALLLEKIYESTAVPDVEADVGTSFLPDHVTEAEPGIETVRPQLLPEQRI